MRGRSNHNQQAFSMRSPQRAISPVIQIVPQVSQAINLDIVINLKLEKVLMSFEIQRLNSLLLDIEKKRMAIKNQNQKLLEREQIMLLEIQNQKQQINDLLQKEKISRDKLHQLQRSVSIQEIQLRDQSMNDQLKKLQEENVLLEQKISFLLGVNQSQSKKDNLTFQISGGTYDFKEDFQPQSLQIAFENLQNNIISFRKGNMLQIKYANALTMLSELMVSHQKLLKKYENNKDNNDVELQQIQIYLTSLNQDVEALRQYETPKAVRRILNNQSPTKGRSLSPSLSTGEVFTKIISHIEHLQLDGNNIPTIIKQISLLNSLVRLKNQDLKLIGTNNKLRSSPIRYSAERLNSSVRVLTPVKYVSPLRISPIRSHTFHSTACIPQKIHIINPNKADFNQTLQFSQQQKDGLKNNQSLIRKIQNKTKDLENEKQINNLEVQFWKQRQNEEIEKQKLEFIEECSESRLQEQIKQNQKLLSHINIIKNDLHQQELENELKVQQKQEEMIKLIEAQSKDQQQKLYLQKQIEELLQKDIENQTYKQQMLIKLQQKDEEMERLKNTIAQNSLKPQEQDNIQIQLCEPLLIEKNSKKVENVDTLKEKNIELQEKIIELLDQLNKINSQPKKEKQQNLINQEITDPEKTLKISQLEQENQKLKIELKENELQRNDDLQEFQQMIGNGISQQTLINLISEKQSLQENFRIQQNKIDALQQNQIKLQTELQIKHKDLENLEQFQNQKNQIQIQDLTLLNDQIKNLQQQLNQAKKQYQDLLEISQQNLTPNGLKEKVLQQQFIIHEQENQINNLHNKIEQQIPNLEGELAVAKEKIQTAENFILNQEKRYNELLDKKKSLVYPQQQADADDQNKNVENKSALEKENQILQQKVQDIQIELDLQQKLRDEIHEKNRENQLVQQLNQIQQDQIKDFQSKLNKMIEKEKALIQELNDLKLKFNSKSEIIIDDQQEFYKPQLTEIIQSQDQPNFKIHQLQDELKRIINENELKDNELKNLQISKSENEELRIKQNQLYYQIIQLQNQINQQESNQPSKSQDVDQRLKFETDPEKTLLISQLQQENQLLKNQLQEIENQRTEDLKKFQETVENGVNQQQIIELFQSKQKLELQLRDLQNKLDKALQEQIFLQGLLIEKNKQYTESQLQNNDNELKIQIENFKQIIEEQNDKLKQSKQQYLELLELSSQNLTPNGQREKFIQNMNQIHEQQEQIQLLHHQLENQVPQLQGELVEFKQKYNDSQKEIKLIMESYQSLLNQRQKLTSQLQEQINDQSYSINNNNNLQDISQSIDKQDNKQDQTNVSEYQDDLIRKNNLLEQEIFLIQKQNAKYISELEDLNKLNKQKDQEILNLKNKLAEGNFEFWKDEYAKLVSQLNDNSQQQTLDSSQQNQIYYLQQINSKLKCQVAEVELERQEDLKKFQNIFDNGKQDNQLVQLFSEKQELQSSLRQMQIQIEELQYKLLDKDQQIKQFQDSNIIQNLANQIQELKNQNQLISQQLLLSKEEYKQLYEQAVNDLSPNDLKEKLLKTTQTIHQQKEEILELQYQIKINIPKLSDQLQDSNQKYLNAVEEVQNWKEKYMNLLQLQQEIPPIQIDDETIKNMNLQQAQEQIQILIKNNSNVTEILQQANLINAEQKKLINQHEDQIKQQKQQVLDLQQQNLCLKKLNESQTIQIENQNKYIQTEFQKIADLEFQENQQTGYQFKMDQSQQEDNLQDIKSQNILLQKQLENQVDQNKINKIQFQEQLLSAQNQINDLLKNQVPTPLQSQEQIQFQIDPEKTLQLSQLQQQNQSLKQQIEELEQNRKKDLQKFQDLIQNGVNENQIVILLQEKQQLQLDLRVLQNKFENLQQEQLILQNQLTLKTKQLIDIHNEVKQDQTKKLLLQLQNENDLLKKQLEQFKDQYQELLQLQSENLTPNGLREKILKQTECIHTLEEQIQILQNQLENQIPQLSGEIIELKQRLIDAQNDAQLWNSKYNEILQIQQYHSDNQIQILQQKIVELEEKIQKEKFLFDQLINEQYNQLSPTSAQAKLLKAIQQIADLEEKLQLSEVLKNQYQAQFINSNNVNDIQEQLESLKQKVQIQENLNQVQESQILFYKNQLSQQNQPSINQQLIDQIQIEKQKSEFWRIQYSDIIKQQEPQGNLQIKLKQKEDELNQWYNQPQVSNVEDLLNELENIKQQNIYLQQLIINTRDNTNTQELRQEAQSQYLQEQDLEVKNQALKKQVEDLKKINEEILQQMNKGLVGDGKNQQIMELIQKNNLLSLTNSKLLIDLEANQKEIIKCNQQLQKQNQILNSSEKSERIQIDQQRVLDQQNQIDLLGQQIDFWKQKYQSILNDFSQEHSPESLQKKVIEQVSQIHQQEEALFILQQTTDKVKLQHENKINQLLIEVEVLKNENVNMSKSLIQEQNTLQSLFQQQQLQQEKDEKQIKFWKYKYEDHLKITIKNPDRVQAILKQDEDEIQNLNIDQNLIQTNIASDLIDRLRRENQNLQEEIRNYKKQILEFEQQQQKIEPSQQDTIQSRQYQITQLERDLQKALQNQEYWQLQYNDVVQQNINKEIGLKGDAQNSASYWRQKYDQAEKSRQELIQKLTEKEDQLEQNMQSFQSMLKDELKEELTKIRFQERQKIKQQQGQSKNESDLIEKMKAQHDIEKQQLIKEFLKRIDQLLISNVQKYPEGENWKELILKYEKQRQNELYELKQQLQILQRSQIQTQDIEFYAERRVYENTINELKNRIQNSDQQELFDTIEYQRKVIQDLEDQLQILQSERSHLNRHIQEQSQEIDMLRENIQKYQLQSDNRKKQRLEVLEAISEMKRGRTQERESSKSPFNQIRFSQNRQSWDLYPRDYLRPSNISQQHSQYKEHNSPIQRMPYQSSQFISPQQENREIPAKLQELEEIKYKYQKALNNILKLETQVVEKLKQDDIIIE